MFNTTHTQTGSRRGARTANAHSGPVLRIRSSAFAMAAAKRVGTLLKGIGGRLQHLYYATNFALMSTYALIRPGVLAHEKGKDYVRRSSVMDALHCFTQDDDVSCATRRRGKWAPFSQLRC